MAKFSAVSVLDRMRLESVLAETESGIYKTEADFGQSKTVSFHVNKTYGGTLFTPGIHAYAMYDDTIRALIPGRR